MLVKFDTYISQKLIKYTGWQNDSHFRFFKKGFLEYPGEEVHAKPILRGRKLILPSETGKIQHFNFTNLQHLIHKINSYSDGEAIKLNKTSANVSLLRSLYWSIRHFYKRYVKREIQARINF